MRTLEGIRYLINLDSAEIQQNFAATSKGTPDEECKLRSVFQSDCKAGGRILQLRG